MKWLERFLALVAGVMLASMTFAAWLDTSQAWDVWYYHLPFAARLFGIVGGDAYVFSPMNAARFAGFPLGGEILQGLLWRLTGRPEAANFVALLSIPLFAWILRRTLGVAWHHTVLALLAVPLVVTHATSCYVDLPANVCAAGLILLTAHACRREPDRKTIALAVALAIGAAHLRFQLAPITFLALAVLAVRARGRGRLAVLGSAPVVFAWPLKNLVLHRNPVFPVELRVGPNLTFPGVDTPYAASPKWLEGVPAPIRFIASVLEVGVRPLSDPARWSVDQWTPPDHPGYRMGGFFGAYVVFLVLVLAVSSWRARRGLDPMQHARIGALAALTFIVAWLPQSHELRYYLVWMLVLVAVTLAAVPPRLRSWLALACAGFALTVAVVTKGAYSRPSGDGFSALLERRTDRRALDAVRDGERVCLSRPPFTFLHAARFHPPRRYVVLEAGDDDPCPPR